MKFINRINENIMVQLRINTKPTFHTICSEGENDTAAATATTTIIISMCQIYHSKTKSNKK